MWIAEKMLYISQKEMFKKQKTLAILMKMITWNIPCEMRGQDMNSYEKLLLSNNTKET